MRKKLTDKSMDRVIDEMTSSCSGKPPRIIGANGFRMIATKENWELLVSMTDKSLVDYKKKTA